jgi:hypothetical protein
MFPLTLVCALALSGCATGKVEQVRTGLQSGRISSTDQVYVKDFDASKAEFKGDYSDVPEKVAVQRGRVPVIISDAITRELQKRGYNAKKYSPDAGPDAVVVDGEVTLVDSGSGAARFWVGMGAGSSTVRANVKVYRASAVANPLADLQMAGTSGGAGGFGGYQDWVAANSKDLAIKLAKYLAGK